MKRQVYYSVAIVILSFIAVKHIRKAGLEYYIYSDTYLSQSNGYYTLNKPDKVTYLPFELREISGLTDLTNDKIVCIHDEAGILFIYDLNRDSIIQHFQFEQSGDFEGLTRVGTTYYALRSDATIFQINYPYDSMSVTSKKLNLPSLDHEGLCFDERENRLLLAPKSKLGKGPENKDSRVVYAIDLTTMNLIEDPILSISLSEIVNFAKSNGLVLPVRYKQQTGEIVHALKFMPSSLSVHPITDEIYILSAVDKTMAVFSKSGELKNYCMLDSTLFNKPEGITFLPDGTMIITNEGEMGHPSLLKFSWRQLNESTDSIKN